MKDSLRRLFPAPKAYHENKFESMRLSRIIINKLLTYYIICVNRAPGPPIQAKAQRSAASIAALSSSVLASCGPSSEPSIIAEP